MCDNKPIGGGGWPISLLSHKFVTISREECLGQRLLRGVLDDVMLLAPDFQEKGDTSPFASMWEVASSPPSPVHTSYLHPNLKRQLLAIYIYPAILGVYVFEPPSSKFK